MILAAGRGERMRPLTDHTPKPLLEAGGKPLIVHHLERLAAAGIREVVVNSAWLGERIVARLGDGAEWGLSISHSPEAQALETAGGIAQALPLLGPAPFLVVNGDVWCDTDFSPLPTLATRLAREDLLAWCLLVSNPGHNPRGDFGLDDGRLAERRDDAPAFTFSGIGLYHPALFSGIAPGTRAPLAPLLREAAHAGRALATLHAGRWTDVGTPERLARLDADLRTSPQETPR